MVINNNKNSSSFIDRISRILLCLSKGYNSVSEIARNSDLSMSAVHRILNSLIKPRFVVYDRLNHRYYLGQMLDMLTSNPITTHQFLITCARKEMQRLSNICRETISLDALIGIQFYPLHFIPSTYSLRVEETGIGYDTELLPLGAPQKALIAQISDDKLVRSLMEINRSSDQTINIESVLLQLEEVRERGYAISHSDRNPGSMGISVLIEGYHHPLALTILGLESRIVPYESDFIEELLVSKKLLSNDIQAIIGSSNLI